MPELEIHYADDWAALYVDGELDSVGDSYLAEEKALEIRGVKLVHDNAFMRGQIQRDGVAKTLDEVKAYRTKREQNRARAAELRELVIALLDQAGRLDRDG